MISNGLANITGAHRSISDWRQFIDSSGSPLDLPRNFIEVPCTAAIARGNPVKWDPPASATDPIGVVKMGTGVAAGRGCIGIALNATTAAGQMVRVCTYGFCFALVTGLTVAADEYGTNHASTAGLVQNASAALDATTIVGSILGTFLGAKLTVAPNVDLAPFWFDHF